LCHDATITEHSLDRFSVDTVKCIKCQTVQPPNGKCIQENCKNIFGEYYCDICHLFENNKDKEIYHCIDCGICRVGKKENYRHCIKCNHCIHMDSAENHKCFAGTWNDCPICIDTLKDSTRPLFLLPCGHGTHTECMNKYLLSDYRCPICKKSIGNMDHVWERIKNSLEGLRGNVNIQLLSTDGQVLTKNCICNDCGENYEIEKNVFNMYSCPKCFSFNSS
jgi:RING finger/CHY zinc finger protein 1